MGLKKTAKKIQICWNQNLKKKKKKKKKRKKLFI